MGAALEFELPRGSVITQVTAGHPDQFDGDMITIETGGDAIESTWNHPFFVVRGDQLDTRPVPGDRTTNETASTPYGRWVEARDLRTGDVLMNTNGPDVTVARASSWREAAVDTATARRR